MHKRLTAIGNSYGLIIEKPILELLGIGPDTVLEMSTDGRRLWIEPTDKVAHRRRVAQASKQILKLHEKTFRKLAKS